MAKYYVEIKETLVRTLDVEADTSEDALKQIVDRYESCDIELTTDDHAGCTRFVVTDSHDNVCITK